jgi:ketosteroid isomerase-like protein
MPERTLDPEPVAAAAEEAEAVAELHRLNAEYIRAYVESDVAWYDEHLSDDFVCTLADGRRIDKPEFLRRTEQVPDRTNMTYHDIDVRLHGDTAVVHGVTQYTLDGSPGATRYTDVWQRREGRWQAVAAQLTRVA